MSDRDRSFSWFDDCAARACRLQINKAEKEEARMVIAETVVGKSLCIEQVQCSVAIRLGQLEIVFAGAKQLVDLKWVLCGTRTEATGSGGSGLSVEQGDDGVVVVLQRAGDTQRCQLSLAQWEQLRRGNLCNAITDALSFRGGSPLIADPAV